MSHKQTRSNTAASAAAVLAVAGSILWSAPFSALLPCCANTARAAEAKAPLKAKAGAAKASPTSEPEPKLLALADIKFLYQLDPRLSKGLHMGERWVSPPKYIRVLQGDERSVEVRVQGIDVNKGLKDISPEWTVEDPEMLTVSPSKLGKAKGRLKGRYYTITARKPGQSVLKVASEGLSKELVVKATEHGTGMLLEISPKPDKEVAHR